MNSSKKLLTPIEVAEILSISKRTVYEIIKRNELKAYKVGNKFRIDIDDLNAYIGQKDEDLTYTREEHIDIDKINSSFNELYKNYIEDKIIICGQDLILDILAKYMNQYKSNRKILRLFDNSFNGLCALYNNDVHITACHIWNSEINEYNTDFASRVLIGIPITVITLCHRTQGLYVAKDNPKRITGWNSLTKGRVKMINRELGSGSRILLDQSIRKYNIDKNKIDGYNEFVNSAGEVINMIKQGRADVGVGLKEDINCPEYVDFLPLHRERYDLIIKSEDLIKPQFKQILNILSMKEFKEECMKIKDYDYSEMGKIVFET